MGSIATQPTNRNTLRPHFFITQMNCEAKSKTLVLPARSSMPWRDPPVCCLTSRKSGATRKCVPSFWTSFARSRASPPCWAKALTSWPWLARGSACVYFLGLLFRRGRNQCPDLFGNQPVAIRLPLEDHHVVAFEIRLGPVGDFHQ